jgi:PAS domain S-box-containing protein
MATSDPREEEAGRTAAEPPGAPAQPGSDERLDALLFDLSPFPAVVSRVADHVVVAINARTAELVGVPRDKALGVRVTDYYVDPSQRQVLIDQLQAAGRADDVRVQLRRPDGRIFWSQASARLVNYQGEAAVLTVFNDITDQVAAEQALRASERRLAAQSEALTDLTAQYANLTTRFGERLGTILKTSARTLQAERLSMWRFDDERKVIFCVGLYRCSDDRHESGAILPRTVAPAYFDALERDRVIAAGDAATDPRTREFLESYLKPFGIGAMLDVPLRQNNVTVGVLCAEHVGGPRTWTIDEQNFAISSANLIAVAVADDELHTALNELAESNARARLVVDTAHDAFIGVDSAGRIVTWNAQAEKTLGWTVEEAVGRSLVDTIIPPDFREAHMRGMARFHETGEAPVVNKRLELAALHRDGHEFPIEITITSPMRQKDGYFFGAFLRDISDRREHDDQLRRAKESAEAATRAKSDFLANMSHELRTPLNGVLGYAQLLQRDRSLSPAHREALDAISRSGSHLLALINDILDLSKIEAGMLDVDPTPTDLMQLGVDLRYVLGEAARRKGLTLTMRIAADVPSRVMLDGRHVRQVLLNLLGNAIKFTAQGEIRLDVGRLDSDRLLFAVTDPGIGIEPEALGKIFEAFTQTEAGARAGGTGLGLAISDQLIRRMGGDLRVESTPGRGSRFFFALKLVTAEGAAPQGDVDVTDPTLDSRLAPGEQLTALVVDDSTVSRRILAALLESAGIRVITAAGGFEAIQLAQAHRPDVVLMDLKMSDLDGLEATRRLKADPATAAIPVIAVTASTYGNKRQAARDAGCVEYLVKPVRAELVFGALQAYAGARFVRGSDMDVSTGALDGLKARRRADLAARLRQAVDIGDVSALEALARELAGSDPLEAALGQRIARLVSIFDFEGLRYLAASLGKGAGHRPGD